jgi:hypothetical protein
MTKDRSNHNITKRREPSKYDNRMLRAQYESKSSFTTFQAYARHIMRAHKMRAKC